PPSRSTPFPYTTLFRSLGLVDARRKRRAGTERRIRGLLLESQPQDGPEQRIGRYDGDHTDRCRPGQAEGRRDQTEGCEDGDQAEIGRASCRERVERVEV